MLGSCDAAVHVAGPTGVFKSEIAALAQQHGGPTAEQFVLSLLGRRKDTTSGEINAAWRKAGRQGRADNTLSLLVKGRKLKRAKLKDQRGSTYTAAA